MKYMLLKILMKTVGQLSEGIQIGWRTGFDSGVMLEYIYENKPKGITPLGVWLDKQFISNEVWDGVRSRRELLITQLKKALEHYTHPTIFDLAAGVGSYLFLLPEDQATIIAGDFEMEAVEAGRLKAGELGRQDITFKKSNAFKLDELGCKKADILVSSGFFDILTQDEEIQLVLKNGSAVTQPGARWVFTIQEHHPDLRLIKETMIDLHKKSWDLVPRPAEILIEWAKPYGWELEALNRNEFFAVGTLVRK